MRTSSNIKSTTRHQEKLRYVESFITALERDSSIYLSMHGAPSHRYIDENVYDEINEDTIQQFITDNYCEIPENIILITTTTTNLTLATNEDDEEQFKQLFTTPYWGLDECSKCSDGQNIPYQIYIPGDIVYNQDLSFDAIDKTTFDIYVKNEDEFELYKEEPIKYTKNTKETNIQSGSLIKKNILLKNIPPPKDSGIQRATIHRPTEMSTGFLHKPGTPAITTSINLRGLFNLIKDVYPDIIKSEYLVVYAPYCNPTWSFTGSNEGLCLNYLNDELRSKIEKHGLVQFREFKTELKKLSKHDELNLEKSLERSTFIQEQPLTSIDYDEQDSWLQPEEDSLTEYRKAEREHIKLLQTEKSGLISIYHLVQQYLSGTVKLIQNRLREVIHNNIANRRMEISHKLEHQQPAYWGGNKKTKRKRNKTLKRQSNKNNRKNKKIL